MNISTSILYVRAFYPGIFKLSSSGVGHGEKEQFAVNVHIHLSFSTFNKEKERNETGKKSAKINTGLQIGLSHSPISTAKSYA